MIEATSCGGVVIFRGKILVLYKNFRNKYEGWVLPKGTVEPGEEYKETALREVQEESGVSVTPRALTHSSRTTWCLTRTVLDSHRVDLLVSRRSLFPVVL